MNAPSPLSPASCQAEQLVGQGRVVDAYRLLETAAAGGDGMAAFILGHWRMSGQLVRRDLALSRDFFERAAALGYADAEPVFLALAANGAGGFGRRWPEVLATLRRLAPSDADARRQIDLLDDMPLDPAGDPAAPPAMSGISDRPDVRVAPAFLTGDECAYLRERAAPLLQPSVTVHPVTGEQQPDPIRTSSAAAFPFMAEDPVIHAINRRIAAATGTTYERGEPLQILRYRPGQEYKLHSDALPHTDNQRVATLLVYLNDDYEGGATVFPAAGLSHRGAPGDAIMFRNVDDAGRPDPDARHAGEPVTRGEKYLLSKWIRERPLDLTGPPGRPL